MVCGHFIIIGIVGNRFLRDFPIGLGWNRHVGAKQNSRMGMGHHQLCLVGGYRPRWYFDFGSFTIIPSKVAHVYQSGSRSNDDFCSIVRRIISTAPYGSIVVGFLLDISYAQYIWITMGKFQFTTCVGCFCT